MIPKNKLRKINLFVALSKVDFKFRLINGWIRFNMKIIKETTKYIQHKYENLYIGITIIALESKCKNVRYGLITNVFTIPKTANGITIDNIEFIKFTLYIKNNKQNM